VLNNLASKVGRVWRLIGTAICFLIFGLGGVVLSLLVIPLLFALQKNELKRQIISRRCIGGGFSLFIFLMKNLGVLSYEVRHAERLQNNTGTLIIANHPSLIDVVFLISFFPQAECVVKSAVTRNFFMRSTASAANYISNEHLLELLATCTDRLKQGANLVLFPEATRTVPGQPLQFKLGAAAVASRSGATILPIVIQCAPTTLTKGEPWYHIPRTRPHWVLEVLPPFRPPHLPEENVNSRQGIRELSQQLEELFEHALDH